VRTGRNEQRRKRRSEEANSSSGDDDTDRRISKRETANGSPRFNVVGCPVEFLTYQTAKEYVTHRDKKRHDCLFYHEGPTDLHEHNYPNPQLDTKKQSSVVGEIESQRDNYKMSNKSTQFTRSPDADSPTSSIDGDVNFVQDFKILSLQAAGATTDILGGVYDAYNSINGIRNRLSYDPRSNMDTKVVGLTDVEIDKLADRVAIHNIFEGVDITSLRVVKSDLIRYSKIMTREDKTRYYDVMRLTDVMKCIENVIDKRMCGELGLTTSWANNQTLRQNIDKLQDTSMGVFNDVRRGVFNNISSIVKENLYAVIGAPSIKLPTNNLK
jgi:hypothetical protein